MYKQDVILLEFLRASVLNVRPNIAEDDVIDWNYLMDRSVQHGILALVWDGITESPLLQHLSRNQKISWELSAQEIWNNYEVQKETLDEIVNVCGTNSIRLLLLKGNSLAKLYPKPQSRPSGDIDIFLFGEFERGNKLLANGKVEFDGREATFNINDVTIENHVYLIYKNSRKEKKIEKYLESTLPYSVKTKGGYYKLCPQSELIYLLMHTLTHWGSSSYPLPLRSIVDFSMCIDANKDSLDIPEFKETLKRLSLLPSFSLFVALSEFILKKEYNELHFLPIPQDDIKRAYKLIMCGQMKQDKVPWNIPFKNQFQQRMKHYSDYEWMNAYLPYSKWEIVRKQVYTQCLILLKKVLGISEDKHFKDGFRAKFLNK